MEVHTTESDKIFLIILNAKMAVLFFSPRNQNIFSMDDKDDMLSISLQKTRVIKDQIEGMETIAPKRNWPVSWFFYHRGETSNPPSLFLFNWYSRVLWQLKALSLLVIAPYLNSAGLALILFTLSFVYSQAMNIFIIYNSVTFIPWCLATESIWLTMGFRISTF